MKTLTLRPFLILAGCLAAGLSCAYAAPQSSGLTIRPAEVPPVLDGKDEDAVWEAADAAVGFISLKDGVSSAANRSEVKLAYDTNSLYIFCRGYATPGKSLAFRIKEPDGKVWQDDSFEFIIRPPGITSAYYQINLNGAGAVFDSRNRLEEEAIAGPGIVTRDISWNSGARIAAASDGQSWTAEVSLPLKSLGISSLGSGDILGLNILRYTGDESELSAWGKIPPSGFHSSASFVPAALTVSSGGPRRISFLTASEAPGKEWEVCNPAWGVSGGVAGKEKGVLGKIAMARAGIAGKTYVITARLISREEGKGRIVLNYADTSNRIWKIYLFERARPLQVEQKMNDFVCFPGDAQRIVALVAEKTNDKGEFGIADISLAERRLRFDHYVRAADPRSSPETFPMANEVFLCLPLDRMAVAPGHRLPAHFILLADYALFKRQDLNFRLIFDLPEGVWIARAGIPARPEGASGFADADKLWQAVQRPEGKYRRYVFSRGGSWFPNFSDNRGIVLLLAGTSWPVGKKGKLFYWAEWNDGKQAEREAMIEAVNFPKVDVFCRKFQAGLVLMLGKSPGYDATRVWPELASDLKSWGVNTVDLFMSLSPDSLIPEKKAVVAQLQRAGINAVAGDGFPTIGYILDVTRYRKSGMLGLEIGGQIHLRNNVPVPCPSYRGEQYGQSLTWLADTVRQFEVTRVHLDEEFFKRGNMVCYCERCVSGFRAWMKREHPETDLVDPREFMKQRECYPELVRLWLLYKSRLVADGWYGEVRKNLQAVLNEKGIRQELFLAGTGYLAGESLENNFHDPQYLIQSGILNAFLPMPYYYFDYLAGSVAAAAEEVLKGQNRFFKGKPPTILPYISTGEVAVGQYLDPPEGIRDQILEMAMTGAVQGVLHYFFHAMDGYHCRAMAEGFAAVARIEDIVLNGTAVEEITANVPTVRLRARRLGNRTAVLVSEYSYQPIEARITLAGCPGWKVSDLLTGERLGNTDANGHFPIRINRARCRLLLLKK